MILGKDALPCAHPGAPSDHIIDLVSSAIIAIASDQAFLNRRGLTHQDFNLALPSAIQRIRGRAAASNSDRRRFLVALFTYMKAIGSIQDFEVPIYGEDTVYRLAIAGIGRVAIIQKGCPDGAHSSTSWSVPNWADEAYLWWLCDSIQYEPGEHVVKGVNRLRSRFFSDDSRSFVDGIIFHNATCGTSLRPCPKIAHAARVGGLAVPPPCVWIMPKRSPSEQTQQSTWNWDGVRTQQFPTVLLNAFDVNHEFVKHFIGSIGFKRGVRGVSTIVRSAYGPNRSNTYRSDPA